jgi:hypothetical protein
MEEMASNIKQNADNAAQTEKISKQSAKDAEASGDAVNKAVIAMQTIAEKITIVQEIARQTDLLGAQRGGRSGARRRTWQGLCGGRVGSAQARRTQPDGGDRNQRVSSETVKAARSAGEMLVKLVPDIRKTAELVSEISAACREQDIGASQINEAIQQLDKVTQQNAAASEEMSATSENWPHRPKSCRPPSPISAPIIQVRRRKRSRPEPLPKSRHRLSPIWQPSQTRRLPRERLARHLAAMRWPNSRRASKASRSICQRAATMKARTASRSMRDMATDKTQFVASCLGTETPVAAAFTQH